MRVQLIVGAGLLTAAAAWLAIAGEEPDDASVAPMEFLGQPASQEIIALGKELYAENCASCHGVELQGQPNWKRRLESGRMPAPPHDATGHTWHHSDDDLFRLTKEGVSAVIGGSYESDMPAFGDLLTDEEIIAVLVFIKSTWPQGERDYQTEITRQDERNGKR